ncbi:hypothetical protein AC578_8194 [Pseudocercospora eumusae]|uniref:Uncharacterized protein n=1 Tax=Pseudocercospora eumusae TaxID=321146 RepID=A0A139HET5_9PEZI|nr:hypothetical protein AC578_8194 [Pseudocercospora eumusae]
MRDRRNTNLSISSTDSTNSAVSSRSARDGFNEKRHSSPPPPSPTLPAPAIGRLKVQPIWRRSTALKLVLLCIAVFVLCRNIVRQWSENRVGQLVEQTEGQTEWVAGNDLPGEPTALVVADPTGTSKWTISIPHNWTFPLPSRYYKDMCTQGNALRNSMNVDGGRRGSSHWWRKSGYFSKDHTFLDVTDAEDVGALPKPKDAVSNVCERSMTFLLESDDASFGQTLLRLWLSYGLAKEEGRAFFLDDSRWAWGRYTSYFAPIARPECARPPAHHIVPCPHSAKHLVVSSATTPWTFGSPFQKEFQGHHKHGLASQRRIFELIRRGYEALFHLTGEDALYADSRIAKFKDDAERSNGLLVGMQIRRGDLHPFEYQYNGDYLPLERYADAARSLLQSQRGASSDIRYRSPEDFARSPLILASDDPDILEDPELIQAASPLVIQKAQTRIQLATKATLDLTSPVRPLREPGSAYVKHMDENTGWEGGFYSALFFSLGGAKAGDNQTLPEQALRLRNLVGRAYLLDLAVLSESDGVVCAVSSATCRALAVMMGWNAVVQGRFVNVDDHRAWSWDSQR